MQLLRAHDINCPKYKELREADTQTEEYKMVERQNKVSQSTRTFVVSVCLSVCLSMLCVAFCLCSCIYLSAYTWLSHSMFVDVYLPTSTIYKTIAPKIYPTSSMLPRYCTIHAFKLCSDVSQEFFRRLEHLSGYETVDLSNIWHLEDVIFVEVDTLYVNTCAHSQGMKP